MASEAIGSKGCGSVDGLIRPTLPGFGRTGRPRRAWNTSLQACGLYGLTGQQYHFVGKGLPGLVTVWPGRPVALKIDSRHP